MLNHQSKSFAVLADKRDMVTNKEVFINYLMSSPRTSTILSKERMESKAAKSGFWGWQQDRVEKIGGYSTKVYVISSIELVTKVRTEHTGAKLPEYNGSEIGDAMDDNKIGIILKEMLKYKQSLPPPPPPSMTGEEYFDPGATHNVHLGRLLKLQKRVKSYRSRV